MYCASCGSILRPNSLYCSNCGFQRRQTVAEQPLQFQSSKTEEEIIHEYFRSGYGYRSIVLFLSTYHDINISVHTLKRRLQSYGLRKRGVQVCENELRNIVESEIRGPSSMRGYRGLWHSLRVTHGIILPRDTVMRVLKDVDPEGTEIRKARRLRRRRYNSPGPNFSWHIDGYDKLKPYGFPIHGCIDGFSRRILWLKLSRSNSNPRITAMFFINTLKELKLAPCKVITDCGTENVLIAAIQSKLLNNVESHSYVASTANQRIENWWSHNRKGYTGWLIYFFKQMVDDNEINIGNYIHMELL